MDNEKEANIVWLSIYQKSPSSVGWKVIESASQLKWDYKKLTQNINSYRFSIFFEFTNVFCLTCGLAGGQLISVLWEIILTVYPYNLRIGDNIAGIPFFLLINLHRKRNELLETKQRFVNQISSSFVLND